MNKKNNMPNLSTTKPDNEQSTEFNDKLVSGAPDSGSPDDIGKRFSDKERDPERRSTR